MNDNDSNKVLFHLNMNKLPLLFLKYNGISIKLSIKKGVFCPACTEA